MALKAITFDFIGTLLDGHSRSDLFVALSSIAKDDPTLTPLLMEAAMQYGPRRREDIKNLKQTTLVELIEAVASDHKIAFETEALVALNDKVFDLATSESKLYDDVEGTLGALKKKGFNLGIISNVSFPGSYYTKLIETFGIAHYFDSVLWSSDTGVRKPGQEMFTMMLGELGTKPDEAIHVGDMPNRDVRGAHAVGMKAVWMNRRNAQIHEKEDAPDWIIKKLSELLPIVEQERPE